MIKEVASLFPASSKSFDSAAFPNGLPEALEASVAPMSEGNSSDSDHSGCNCHSGGACHCCVPRKSAPPVRTKKLAVVPTVRRAIAASDITVDKTPPNILARIAELRPVLPKLPQREAFSDGPTHHPSVGGHPGRHHAHEDHFFSPYGRAYDHAHSIVYAKEPAGYTSQHTPPSNEFSLQSVPDITPYAQDQFNTDTNNSWTPGQDIVDPTSATYSSPLCGCGDDCLCPGCSQHTQMGSVSNLTSSPCANPSTCGACFNCTILAVSLPPDTALSIYQPPEDWMQQFSPEFLEMINAADTPLDESKGMLCVQFGTECRCSPGGCICDTRTACMNGNGSGGATAYLPSLDTSEGAGSHLIMPDMSRSRCSSTSSDSSGSSINDQLFPTTTPPMTSYLSYPST